MKIGDTVKDNFGEEFSVTGDGFLPENFILVSKTRSHLEYVDLKTFIRDYTLVQSCDESLPIRDICMFSKKV